MDPVYVLNALLVVPIVCLPKTMLLTAGRVKLNKLVPSMPLIHSLGKHFSVEFLSLKD